jgi:hypothetical protein
VGRERAEALALVPALGAAGAPFTGGEEVRGGGVMVTEGESSPNKIFDLLLIFVSRDSLIPAPD